MLSLPLSCAQLPAAASLSPCLALLSSPLRNALLAHANLTALMRSAACCCKRTPLPGPAQLSTVQCLAYRSHARSYLLPQAYPFYLALLSSLYFAYVACRFNFSITYPSHAQSFLLYHNAFMSFPFLACLLPLIDSSLAPLSISPIAIASKQQNKSKPFCPCCTLVT